MKNRELIAILGALPLDADVFVHGEVAINEDEDVCVDVMFAPRDAHAEYDCDDNQVIRLNCISEDDLGLTDEDNHV